jgi:hypothetical protein
MEESEKHIMLKNNVNTIGDSHTKKTLLVGITFLLDDIWRKEFRSGALEVSRVNLR